MKFYRIDLRGPSHESHGYRYTTSMAEARAIGHAFRMSHGMNNTYEVGHFNVEPTRVGILHALNLYASHNDNG